ncbi:hypothetical protein PENDEC_c020G05153 [Penicillium decumbens]|uniref:Uncharacterized protein n=1 Tax=Penicillium decumbens TaxID=69771 RepID=A0A1V6P746_PENDC|nr:hypothetical protein PENDEC_c020G05153 [Penicillium decumbens]
MRVNFLYALFAATAVAIPHGGGKNDIDHPATSSMPMSMPMKRATPTAYTTPSASASASVRMEKAANAERLMMPYGMSP